MRENTYVCNISYRHTASGAWQVASIAYTASKLESENGIFMKSACIMRHNINNGSKLNSIICLKILHSINLIKF